MAQAGGDAAAHVRSLTGRAVPPALAGIAGLVGWDLLVRLLGVPDVVLPSPTVVGTTLIERWPTLLQDTAVTALTAGIGLLVGLVVGLALAFGMVALPTFEAVVMPYVVALRIAPLVAIGPVLFLWLGRGIPARSALVATLTLFPITVASVAGLRNVPRAYLDVARSVDAPRWQVFLRVRLPVAAGSVFAGVKLAAALAVVGSVVAEFITLTAGLGYRVFVTATQLQTPRTYAALVVLALLGVSFYGVPAVLERRVRRYLDG